VGGWVGFWGLGGGLGWVGGGWVGSYVLGKTRYAETKMFGSNTMLGKEGDVRTKRET